jgi:hypothetical protein
MFGNMHFSTRREVRRYKNVAFTFPDERGGRRIVIARDASTKAACFPAEYRAEILKCGQGKFEMGSVAYRFDNPRDISFHNRSEHLILNYHASALQVKGWFRRMVGLDHVEEGAVNKPKLRYNRPGLRERIKRVTQKVSRIHLYEAQERYVYLLRLLEFYERDGSGCFEDPACPLKERIHSLAEDQLNERFKTKLNQVLEKPTESQAHIKKGIVDACRKHLEEASVLLTRCQEDLNFLWREMTQVHVTIVRSILPDHVLPAHLDFCREEARRLVLDKNPEIKLMIEQLAEVMNETEANRSNKVRLMRALIERFNAIRTGRIHEQLITIRCYQKALIMLMPVTLVLIFLNHLFIAQSVVQSTVPTFPVSAPWGIWGLGYVPSFAKNLFTWLLALLEQNNVAFVFFAGLIGGFFSVVIHIRSRELVPGEDAYFLWYVLTKPWIGALGAVVLFILIKSEVFNPEISKDLFLSISKGENMPALFSMGFLAGFSERLFLPNLWDAGSKKKSKS